MNAERISIPLPLVLISILVGIVIADGALSLGWVGQVLVSSLITAVMFSAWALIKIRQSTD